MRNRSPEKSLSLLGKYISVDSDRLISGNQIKLSDYGAHTKTKPHFDVYVWTNIFVHDIKKLRDVLKGLSFDLKLAEFLHGNTHKTGKKRNLIHRL